VWSEHSCSLLFLLMVVFEFGARRLFNTKIKSDGQECPSHAERAGHELAEGRDF
jgi:hypothetical protein